VKEIDKRKKEKENDKRESDNKNDKRERERKEILIKYKGRGERK
jgi:hypothetical protein